MRVQSEFEVESLFLDRLQEMDYKYVHLKNYDDVFQTSDDIDDRFLWHWFKTEKFQRLIEKYQEGGVRLYFYYDKLCMCSISTSSIEEQKTIGTYFDNLDRLITLRQRKCDELKELKKGLLQQMFC